MAFAVNVVPVFTNSQEPWPMIVWASFISLWAEQLLIITLSLCEKPGFPEGERQKQQVLYEIGGVRRRFGQYDQELNLTEVNEQIHRLRKRLTFAEFSHTYDSCALRYVEMKSLTRPRPGRGKVASMTMTVCEARNSRHNRSVMGHFIDLLFPGALPSGNTKRAGRI
jgi:hypothetical protein